MNKPDGLVAVLTPSYELFGSIVKGYPDELDDSQCSMVYTEKGFMFSLFRLERSKVEPFLNETDADYSLHGKYDLVRRRSKGETLFSA